MRSKRKGWGFSEKQMGFLFVAPAVLLILVIAIWPVLRSFWISLYDIRLNDPTKTQIHRTYGMDMERYVQMNPILTRLIEKERKAAAESGRPELDRLSKLLADMHAGLLQDELFAARYEEIDQLLYDFKPVPHTIKYLPMDNEKMAPFQEALAEAEDILLRLGEAKQMQQADDALGLVRGIQASIIQPNYIGFTYYEQFLTDKRLWASLGNTMFFTIVSVALELVLGLGIALMINRVFWGRGLVRAAVLIPWAIPTVVSAMMWKYLYDGQNGVIAHVFDQIGLIPDSGALLTTKAGAMAAVILADVWKTTPFMALLLFAGLQTIPQSLYEAAEVDGASKVQQFFRITLPLLKPAILVALLFRTLDAFRIFDLVYVLTGGGPANSTETISIYAYKTMFAQMNFGAGSALSVIVFFCVALICIGFIRLLGTDLLGDKAK